MAQVGDRVKLLNMNDPYTRLRPGVLGTVAHVDTLGTVHVRWDDGRSLGLIPGVDQFTIVGRESNCDAFIWHGPGHQSRTRCQVTGPHAVHETVYGAGLQLARWTGREAMTGFFDEPPEDEDES